MVEVLTALTLVILAMFVLAQSWKRSRDLSSFTRNRAAAVLLADSLLEEIRAHRFGQPAPASWGEGRRPALEVWVDGRPRPVALRHRVTCKSGAFLGQAEGGSYARAPNARA